MEKKGTFGKKKKKVNQLYLFFLDKLNKTDMLSGNGALN